MSTSEHVFWLAVPHDQREVARAAAGRLEDGRPALAWNNDLKLWYARPGCDLERVREWFPDASQRFTGGDPESEFLDALTAAGLDLKGLPIMDGKRHRVATVEDKKGKKSGVYRGFLDGRPAGWFINYHQAANEKDVTNWSATGGEADPVARMHIRARAQQSKDDAERQRVAEYAKNRASAQRLFGIFTAADPAHGYLERKGITPTPDLRQTNNGALVVPFYNVRGEFQTLQYIPVTGDKYLYEGAPKQGHFLAVGGELKNGEPILYAEGYATARSLNLAMGLPVVMTIDAGNMVAVAKVLHEHYPDSPHLFLSDFDHAKQVNKGLIMATSAAEHVGGHVLYPQFSEAELGRGFTDFNDLHQSRGLDAVAAQISPTLQLIRKEPDSMDKSQPEEAPASPSPGSAPTDATEIKPINAPESVAAPVPLTQHEEPQPAIPQQPDAAAPKAAASAAKKPRAARAPAKPAQPAAAATAPAAPKKPRARAKPVEPVPASKAEENAPANAPSAARPETQLQADATGRVAPDEKSGAAEVDKLDAPAVASGTDAAVAVDGAEAVSPPQAVVKPAPLDLLADDVAEIEQVSPGQAKPPASPVEEETIVPPGSGPDPTPIGTPLGAPISPAGEQPAAGAAVDAIWVGPPRPGGEEPPELKLIDKDALLARLTWEKQDNNTVLYKLDGEPAFIDQGMRLEMADRASESDEKVLAALLTAAQYYRGRIELTGSEDFQRKAIGLIAQHQLNVSMKNPAQQAQLEDARKALQAVSTPKDSIGGDAPPLSGTAPQAEVAPTESPVAAPTAQVASPKPVPAQATLSSTPPPASDAAVLREMAIHTPHSEAKSGVKGKVMDFGNGPFRFDATNTDSTYIKLRTREGIQTFWGKELAGLLRETRIQKGNVVTLKWLGSEPVTIKVPIKDEHHKVVRYEEKQTHRNQWSLEPMGRPAVTTGDDVGVKLSAYDVERFSALQHELMARMRLEVPLPDRPMDGLFWMTPDGEGSAKAGDHLTAPRPVMDVKAAGQPVMSSWTPDGQLDMALVRGDGPYLQGVVRHEGQLQHVLVSLPNRDNAPSMVFNLVTPAGLSPIGVGHGINTASGVAVSRESIAFKLDGDTATRVGKLERPAEIPPALHARLGFDERWRDDNTLPKSAPAAAPTAQPSEPRPA